jgi:hypothetical protein
MTDYFGICTMYLYHADPHTATTLLKHSLCAYSPNVAYSDYHLFSPFINVSRDCSFANYREMKEAVHMRLVTEPKKIFRGHAETYVLLD